MLTIEVIKEKLSDKNLSEVARRVGISPAYLSAICRGVRANPSYDKLKKISEYFEMEEGKNGVN